GIDRGPADAEIGRESGEKYASDSALVQIAAKSRARAAIRLAKSRIAVDLAPKPFANDQLRVRNVERGREIGAGGALHAMLGPQHLLAVVQFDFREVRAAMRRRKGMMRGRVPILRQDDVRKAPREIVDDGNDRVAIGHGERAARQEIILHIDDQKNIAVGEWMVHGPY